MDAGNCQASGALGSKRKERQLWTRSYQTPYLSPGHRRRKDGSWVRMSRRYNRKRILADATIGAGLIFHFDFSQTFYSCFSFDLYQFLCYFFIENGKEIERRKKGNKQNKKGEKERELKKREKEKRKEREREKFIFLFSIFFSINVTFLFPFLPTLKSGINTKSINVTLTKKKINKQEGLSWTMP
jgi:hypothetical protein